MENNYIASVIIPVFNAEKYLEKCLDSLVAQSIGINSFEVLLVDDGSTDLSFAICKRYCSLFPSFRYYYQENQGVSAARNLGICNASGKFLFFLDSDDTISVYTIENVTKEFDKHYFETDIYTYPIKKYDLCDNLLSYRPMRFNYMKENGIYDIEKYPFICQTTMNICVKKSALNCILFDCSMSIHEDQKFINQVVLKSGNIGFCNNAEYRYIAHTGSTMSDNKNPMVMIELTLKYYRTLFDMFDKVPQYIQTMYINDLNWKLKSNVLFPYHYNENEFDRVLKEIGKLLQKTDVSLLMRFPDMNIFHKAFWLRIRENNSVMFGGNMDYLCLLAEGKEIYRRERVEIILNRVMCVGNTVRFLCFAKSPVFEFTDKPIIYAVIYNANEEVIEKRQLNISESAFGFYGCRTKTNHFWATDFELEVSSIIKIELKVEIEGIEYMTDYFFMGNCPFSEINRIFYFAQNGNIVKFDQNAFWVWHASMEQIKRMYLINGVVLHDKNPELYKLRNKALEFSKKNAIWIYCDSGNDKEENGFLQYIHDLRVQDGVDRYYVNKGTNGFGISLDQENMIKRIIQFGTDIHKILYLNSDVIVSSCIDYECISPFSVAEREGIKDLERYKIVYLQQNIMFKQMPWINSYEKVRVDKIVVSSHFEIENLINNYHYKKNDIMCVGNPKYEFINKSKRKHKHILFVFDFRDYLRDYNVKDSVDVDVAKLKDSDYFNKLQAFLNNTKLFHYLDVNDYYIDVKLPNELQKYKCIFETDCKRVSFVNDNDIRDFIITDFSDEMFNYVYFNRPVLYFIPDIMQFRAGMHTFRNLDLELENGFGSISYEVDEIVERVIETMNDQGTPIDEYQRRMEGFFVDISDCRDKIYSKLVDMTKTNND